MVLIKICGLTNPQDYWLIVASGAHFSGFIFYDKSPRAISPQVAAQIIKQGPKGFHRKVGVFVNEQAERIQEIFYQTGLDIVQLHGDESPQYCRDLNLPIWKTISVKDESSIQRINEYPCDTFLLDTYSSSQYGGTGKRFNPELIKKALKTGKKIIVAGGVSIGNVREIINLSPYAIDISSSLEEKPGQKSKTKTKKFFKIIEQKDNTHA